MTKHMKSLTVLLASLASSVFVNAIDPRPLPVVACLNQNAIDQGISFEVHSTGDFTEGDRKVDDAMNSMCLTSNGRASITLGELTIDAARGATTTIRLLPLTSDLAELAGVPQKCVITTKNWPSKFTSTLFIWDYNAVNPDVNDVEPLTEHEGLFSIECHAMDPETAA